MSEPSQNGHVSENPQTIKQISTLQSKLSAFRIKNEEHKQIASVFDSLQPTPDFVKSVYKKFNRLVSIRPIFKSRGDLGESNYAKTNGIIEKISVFDYTCETVSLDSIDKSHLNNSGPVSTITRKITDYAKDGHFYKSAIVTKDELILARQHLYTRNQASNGTTKIIWSIYNLEECLRLPNVNDNQTRKLRSSVFAT